MAKYILPPLPGYFVKFAAKTHLCFSPCYRFILLACDGLFKVFTPEEAVNFILSCLEVSTLRRGGCPLFRLPLGFRGEVPGPFRRVPVSPGPFPPCPRAPSPRVPVQPRAPFLPCPRAVPGPLPPMSPGGSGTSIQGTHCSVSPTPPPRGLGAVVPRGGHLRSGGARAPCSPAPLSHPVGREDPKAGREAHCGRPLRSRLQQAGQQGGAAGLGGQCHRDGGADRALRRARWRGLDSEVRFLCCAHYVFRVLLWDAHGCK